MRNWDNCPQKSEPKAALEIFVDKHPNVTLDSHCSTSRRFVDTSIKYTHRHIHPPSPLPLHPGGITLAATSHLALILAGHCWDRLL